MIPAVVSVFALTSVHKEMHEGTGEQQQVRKNPEQMSAMFAEEQEGNDCKENEQYDAASRTEPTTLLRLNFVIHKTSNHSDNDVAVSRTCLNLSPAI